MKAKKKSKLEKALDKSFINYFSDLFIVIAVLIWIFVLVIMIVMAVYATVNLADTYMWSYVADTASIPLSAGVVVWLLKCSAQHFVTNKQGKQVPMDFPGDDLEDGTDEEPTREGALG